MNFPIVVMAGLLLVIAVFLILLFEFHHLQRRWDYQWIKESVQSRGWTVLKIQYCWFSGARQGRRYQVVYQTDAGRTVTAECHLSFWFGNQWISREPFAA